MSFLKNKWVIALLVMVVGVMIEARTGFFSKQWASLTGKTTTAGAK